MTTPPPAVRLVRCPFLIAALLSFISLPLAAQQPADAGQDPLEQPTAQTGQAAKGLAHHSELARETFESVGPGDRTSQAQGS